MKRMEEIIENTLIDLWTRQFPRSKCQINQPHESDAELFEIEGNPYHYIAVTIDTVAEEITEGLYQDPYTMGWVTVMANLSDLAAVGADPLGLVISVSVESSRSKSFSEGIAQGMADACKTSGTFILGGDTNITQTISLTGCAIGLVPRNEKISRCGCKKGDIVFISSGVGIGNALGLMRLANLSSDLFPENFYRPIARLKEGRFIRKYASCCMDTSDGLLTTLDQLMRINNVGFTIDCNWEKILIPSVLEFCDRTSTPYWLMSAGQHGEFELVFTVKITESEVFLAEAQAQGFHPIRIGTIQQTPCITLVLTSGDKVEIDMIPLRNLLQTVNGDLKRYVQEFRRWGKKWGLE